MTLASLILHPQYELIGQLPLDGIVPRAGEFIILKNNMHLEVRHVSYDFRSGEVVLNVKEVT